MNWIVRVVEVDMVVVDGKSTPWNSKYCKAGKYNWSLWEFEVWIPYICGFPGSVSRKVWKNHPVPYFLWDNNPQSGYYIAHVPSPTARAWGRTAWQLSIACGYEIIKAKEKISLAFCWLNYRNFNALLRLSHTRDKSTEDRTTDGPRLRSWLGAWFRSLSGPGVKSGPGPGPRIGGWDGIRRCLPGLSG
jgi:hypothetical protein